MTKSTQMPVFRFYQLTNQDPSKSLGKVWASGYNSTRYHAFEEAELAAVSFMKGTASTAKMFIAELEFSIENALIAIGAGGSNWQHGSGILINQTEFRASGKLSARLKAQEIANARANLAKLEQEYEAIEISTRSV